MEFDEVSHFVRHGKIVQVSSIDERNIDALGVASPYYHHHRQRQPSPEFPSYAPPIALKKRPIGAKFVDSVRHRLLKSATTPAAATPISSDDDDLVMARHIGRRRLFSRLKKQQQHQATAMLVTSSNSSSGDEGGTVDGYRSLDEVYSSSRRPLWRKRQRQRRRIRRRLLFPSREQDRPPPVAEPAGAAAAATASSTASDLREISDQMRSFCVPADWANMDQASLPATPALFDKPSTSISSNSGSISSVRTIMADLTDRIHQYQYLCNQERARIATSRQTIEDQIALLEHLDRRVETLNATITHARSERLRWMQHMLQDTQHRSPLLRHTRALHKAIVARIEAYCKSMNYAAHLAELQTKADAARERQALWFCVQRWLPPAVILLAFVLLSLLISYF